MFNIAKISIAAIVLIAITSVAFVIDLEYRNVVDGKIKILIPKNFTEVIKKPIDEDGSIGHKISIDQYSNKDTSENIVFVRFDKADI